MCMPTLVLRGFNVLIGSTSLAKVRFILKVNTHALSFFLLAACVRAHCATSLSLVALHRFMPIPKCRVALQRFIALLPSFPCLLVPRAFGGDAPGGTVSKVDSGPSSSDQTGSTFCSNYQPSAWWQEEHTSAQNALEWDANAHMLPEQLRIHSSFAASEPDPYSDLNIAMNLAALST